ncbi:MAG: hypothetical protein OHK0023_11790 [Anaerolineae bacterium]
MTEVNRVELHDVAFWIALSIAILNFVLLTRSAGRAASQQIANSSLRRMIIRSQKEYQRLEDLNIALADAAFDPILVVNVSRDGRFVVELNRMAQTLFDISPTDAKGKTVMLVTRHHEIDDFVARLAADGETPDMQITINDGTFRMRGVLASYADGQRIVVIALQDITELLRLTRARRDMVANFSHDLRTPISNIRLLVESLQLSLGRNPERDKKQLSKLASEADSLQHMTQELIDLSMIESGQAIMRMVNTPFEAILNNALTLMQTQFEERRLHFDQIVPSHANVLADPDQMRRVLANVLHNAVKFTPAEGKIRCTARITGDMLEVRISDTGPGIPPHEHTRVFERFYQVDSARTGGAGSNNKGGTGLGLAIAKHIVEAHGGKIWAEGAIPSGACIVFTLPLAEERTTAAPVLNGAKEKVV